MMMVRLERRSNIYNVLCLTYGHKSDHLKVVVVFWREVLYIYLTAETPSFTLPVSVSQREGCISASEGEVYFYIGAGINRQTNQAFNDLYLIDTIHDTIISCSPSLSYPIYY